MKRILMSVLTIGLVSSVSFGATRALFTDTETSHANTFTTGTIDISVGDEPWTDGFELLDMKPSYTNYINFTVHNDGTNPANITKVVGDVQTGEGEMSEPECLAESGTWEGDHCKGAQARDNIDTVIGYDLWVEIYSGDPAHGAPVVWHQMLYNDDVTISDIANKDMFLGMLPAGWYMKVYQSYHMRQDTGNWAQGDTMSFNITLNAEQLTGTLVLEDKSGDPDWDINQSSAAKGTLTYEMSSPTFKFDFSGVAPTPGVEYTLVIGDNPWDAGQTLGTGMADGSGNVTISGDTELGRSYDHAKVWLILSSDWNGSKMIGWHGSEYLYETGLIEYRDTGL